jgi:hypothetical protein
VGNSCGSRLADCVACDERGRTLVENQFRFGVFLRPDPKTCAAVTQITGQLRAQYGLISAGAFPPHVTLAGSLPVVVPLAELIQLIGFVLRRKRSFQYRTSVSGGSRMPQSPTTCPRWTARPTNR